METSPPPSPWDRLVADVRGAGEWSAALIRDGLAPSLRRLWAWLHSEEGDLWSARQALLWRGPLWLFFLSSTVLVITEDGPGGVQRRAAVWTVVLLWVGQDLATHGLPSWMGQSVLAAARRWAAWPAAIWARPWAALDWLWDPPGLTATPTRTRIERCTRCESWAVHRCWAEPERRTPAVCLDCREHAQAALERAQAGEGRD